VGFKGGTGAAYGDGMDPFDLTGRTALVTGASRGIGRAIAVALDRAGARVAVSARSADELRDLAGELQHQPVVLTADLARPESPGELGAAALEALGGLDVLVNNAGVGRRKDSHTLTGEDIDWMLAVNVRAPLLLCAAVLPAMVARGRGSIVNITSVSGVVGAPRRAAYAATKGGMDAATRALAMEYGPHGVRVNAVAPGVVRTDMWHTELARDGIEDQVTGLTALRALSTPEDVADVVVFLASDAARYITGETISADGGLARTLNLHPVV
jgi:NAD(P)-dependent dehydrogenase (short-subunit alcohol dehydrogenase family)